MKTEETLEEEFLFLLPFVSPSDGGACFIFSHWNIWPRPSRLYLSYDINMGEVKIGHYSTRSHLLSCNGGLRCWSLAGRSGCHSPNVRFINGQN